MEAIFETIIVPNGVHTVEDVELACKCSRPEVIKTLLFIGRRPVVVLMTGDKKVSLDKLKEIRGDKSLRLASRDEVSDLTGVLAGTVSPFGLAEVDVIADRRVMELESLIMGSGKSDTLLKMTGSEFRKLYKGSFEAVSQ